MEEIELFKYFYYEDFLSNERPTNPRTYISDHYVAIWGHNNNGKDILNIWKPRESKYTFSNLFFESQTLDKEFLIMNIKEKNSSLLLSNEKFYYIQNSKIYVRRGDLFESIKDFLEIKFNNEVFSTRVRLGLLVKMKDYDDDESEFGFKQLAWAIVILALVLLIPIIIFISKAYSKRRAESSLSDLINRTTIQPETSKTIHEI